MPLGVRRGLMAKTRVRLAALVVAFATLVLVPTSVPDAAAGVQHRPGVAGGVASTLAIQPAIVSGKENTSAVVQNRSSATSMIAMDIYTTGGVLVSGAGI